ncbi:MAG TPA: hypothetical protein VNQ76_06840 [Planctomicrobium sp.]|nr:hypothetical protein [Planctomicrobium sp.]
MTALTDHRRSFHPFIGLALAILCCLGCGTTTSGPSRYERQGTVTISNQPLGSGIITFTPDVSKGNSGPGATALVDQGKYKTPVGYGTIDGPHIVEITGYRSVPQDDGSAKDALPPIRWRVDVDLPAESDHHDFQIPQ